jgi:hypothetical protein
MTVALALCAPAAALADGDPASDVLLIRDVYLPYSPAPARAPSLALTRLLGELRRAGHPFKVALIETRGDLGAYPELFGRAPQYAKLLESEIAFQVKRPRLVVAMQGQPLAGRNLGPKGAAILASVRPDPSAGSNGLVAAATTAVVKLAAAGGHPVKVPAAPQAESGGSHTALYVIAAIAALAGIGLIAVSLRRHPST